MHPVPIINLVFLVLQGIVFPILVYMAKKKIDEKEN